VTPQLTAADGRPLTVRETDELEWSTALRVFDGATFFHETGWLTRAIVERGGNMRWFAVDDADGLVGVIPCAMRRTPLGATVNVLPFPYVGPLHRDGHIDDVVRATQHVFGQLRPIKARMTFDAGLRLETPDESLIAMPGMQPDVTYLFDGLDRSEDELLKTMSSSARKALNFAKREGTEVREVAIAVVADAIASFHEAVYARQGLAPEYSREHMIELATAASQWSEVRASAAYRSEELLAAQLAFLYRGNVYNWVGAATRDRGVMNLVEWQTLMWAKSHGAGVVDLVGAPTPGVAKYKMGLGATARHFFVLDAESWRYRAGVAVQRRLARTGKSASTSKSAE
jgi:hypothetical protein